LLQISFGFKSRGQLINDHFKNSFPRHPVVLFLG
jgi:hypothetical protein